jgi:hypothetical protein
MRDRGHVRNQPLPVRIVFCIILAAVLAALSGALNLVLGVDSFWRGVVDFFVLGALMIPLWRWMERRSRAER